MTQPDINKLTRELAEIQKQMQETRSRAYQSMREALAVREFGGALQKEDKHGVIHISVDAKGSPKEIRIEPGWEDHYEPSQLTGALTAVAQLIEQERQKRTAEHLERHPDALGKLTDEEVEKAFSEAQRASASKSADPVSVLGDIIERYPKMREEVYGQGSQEQNSANETSPVSIVIIADMLVTIAVDEAFAQEASNTKINAEIATALERAKNPSANEDASLKTRLAEDSAQAKAAAMSILNAFRARNAQSKER